MSDVSLEGGSPSFCLQSEILTKNLERHEASQDQLLSDSKSLIQS